jgi:hypothetical protein
LRECKGSRYSENKLGGMVMNRKVNKDEKVNGVEQKRNRK